MDDKKFGWHWQSLMDAVVFVYLASCRMLALRHAERYPINYKLLPIKVLHSTHANVAWRLYIWSVLVKDLNYLFVQTVGPRRTSSSTSRISQCCYQGCKCKTKQFSQFLFLFTACCLAWDCGNCWDYCFSWCLFKVLIDFKTNELWSYL